MALSFTPNDLKQIQKKGLSSNQVQEQVESFRKGVERLHLLAPCAQGSGVRVLAEGEIEELIPIFEQAQKAGRVMKFVPASGAATRMFQALHRYLQLEGSNEPNPEVEEFFRHLEKFAFADILFEFCRRQGIDGTALSKVEGRKSLLRVLLTREGMNFANLPKGLILFHSYPDGPRTSFEEHWAEALQYVQDRQGLGRLHFTVSEEYTEPVNRLFQKLALDHQTLGAKWRVDLSVQKSSTDTLAVDLENQPFRLKDGSLFFRPGGHGALLENLNECGGDIVFIKNIDNVTHERWRPLSTRYKKALGGLLVRVQSQIFSFLKDLELDSVSPERLEEIRGFVRTELGLDLAPGASKKILWEILHRPLRVCGMVRNQGEPGGAPFWVKGKAGTKSLQIVESSQVNREDPQQWEIFCRAGYFNPVDLVCGLKDYQGRPFDLTASRDTRAVFISQKSYGGRPLKALELPGLWNGGMAFWNTVFVEVPVETFAPVKTVNDLLRPLHQP